MVVFSQSRTLLTSIYFRLSFIQFTWFTEASLVKTSYFQSYLPCRKTKDGSGSAQAQDPASPGCVQVHSLATFWICCWRAADGVSFAGTATGKSATRGERQTCWPTLEGITVRSVWENGWLLKALKAVAAVVRQQWVELQGSCHLPTIWREMTRPLMGSTAHGK